MIRISTPSRLHFGLFRLAADATSCDPSLRRVFGGVGLMVEQPRVEVAVQRSHEWSASGPHASRALEAARRTAQALAARGGAGETDTALAVQVVNAPPAHVGLGTGTQLELACARTVALALGRSELAVPQLAQVVGRGLRSGIGVHGFAQGGFLVDGGKAASGQVAPLCLRHAFPEDWRVLLALPTAQRGEHGQRERDAFARLAALPIETERTDALCRLTLLGLVPALVERDLAGFAEALYEFNRKVGEMFAPWQGGIYASAWADGIVQTLRRIGACGVGQSSWGPAVFAVGAPDQTRAWQTALARILSSASVQLVETRGDNCGAVQMPEGA